MTLREDTDGDLTAAEIEHVAEAGNIPKEHLAYLPYWLRSLVFRYRDEIGMYARFRTRRQRFKHIEKINNKAFELNELLEAGWVSHLMAEQEALPWLSRGENPTPEATMKIWEQVGRDITGVRSVIDRSAALQKRLASQPTTSEEQIAGASALKLASHHMHYRIYEYWISLGRDPNLAERSLYVQFVRAIYELVGEEKDEFETIRSRHKAALCYFDANPAPRSHYR